MTENIKNFFPGGNTVQGFFSFYKYLYSSSEKVYIIKGGPGTGKSTTMKAIAEKMLNKGYKVEYHWCSSDNNSLDGVVIPDKKVAVFDGTAPHINDPVCPGAVDRIFNTGMFWDEKILGQYKTEIKTLNKKISHFFKSAYNYLKIAHILDQEKEKIYLEYYNKYNSFKIIKKIARHILPGKTYCSVNTAEERHLFSSAITPQGFVDYYKNITAQINIKYIFTGKPEKEKNKILKNLANLILSHGYYVLFLHSGFNPEKIDLVIIPELNTALINDTLPYDIKKQNQDTIINLNKYSNKKLSSDTKEEIKNLDFQFSNFLDQAINKIKKAKSTHDRLEELYIESMDFSKLDREKEKLIKEIMSY